MPRPRPPWTRPRPQKMVLRPVLRPRPVLRTTSLTIIETTEKNSLITVGD